MSRNFINVTTHAFAGQLDRLSPAEDQADLAEIQSWLRTHRAANRSHPKRTPPRVARVVLETYWQEPRAGFHEQNLNGRRKADFGNKYVLIPWSVEAFDQYKNTGTKRGLITEHVTPIKALWEKLGLLLDEAEEEGWTDEEWTAEAKGYLETNFTLAVVTDEQARAIDTVAKTLATEHVPFQRYKFAADHIRALREAGGTEVTLDVTRFVHPGFMDGGEAT